MRLRQFACVGLLLSCAGGGTLLRAQQPGVGQTPSSLPLTAPIRERGSSVTPAFEGWYFDKDGAQRVMVGYFNRNTKQTFDIPTGPNNHIDPGPADQGQPTHFDAGRQWGVFTIKLPKDFGTRKLSWTIVANGFTNTITLHTNADYIVEPFMDAANKNTPPVLKFKPDGPAFTGPPSVIAEKYTATVGTPLALTVWASDEGPKINIPEPRTTGRGRGAGGRGEPAGRGAAAGREARSRRAPRGRRARRIQPPHRQGAARDEAPRAVPRRKASRRRRQWRSRGRSSAAPATSSSTTPSRRSIAPPTERRWPTPRSARRATTSCASKATTAPGPAAAGSSAAGRTRTSRSP